MFIDFQLDALECDFDQIGKLYCKQSSKYFCTTLKLDRWFHTCHEWEICNKESDGEYWCDDHLTDYERELSGIKKCCIETDGPYD